MTEFVPNTLGLKILARHGKYVDFAGVAYMGEHEVWEIEFSNGRMLRCTGNHRLLGKRGFEYVAYLKVGSKIQRQDGRFTRVTKIRNTEIVEPVYDIVEAAEGNVFVTAGIISHQCKFVTDEETLIDPMCLSRLRAQDNPAYFTQQVRWYLEPLPNRTYLVALDPSMGTGGDYAAIQVFMLPELIQVAEWQHNETVPREQVRTLLQILVTLEADLDENPEQHSEPSIFWTVENNSIGDTILHIIEDTGEDKFPGSVVNEKKRRGQKRRFRKGLTTSATTKLSSCARFKSLIESDRMIINSAQTLRQMKAFVAHRQSYAAKPGQHDDLVSALLLITRMLDIVVAMGEMDGSDLSDGIDVEQLFVDPMPIVV